MQSLRSDPDQDESERDSGEESLSLQQPISMNYRNCQSNAAIGNLADGIDSDDSSNSSSSSDDDSNSILYKK